MTAEAHIKSTLRRVETLVGRPLTYDELASVLVWLAGWRGLLASGMPPEQVADLIRAEAFAGTEH